MFRVQGLGFRVPTARRSGLGVSGSMSAKLSVWVVASGSWRGKGPRRPGHDFKSAPIESGASGFRV